MYEAPQLTRLGTLREITHAGISGVLDSAAQQNDGCSAVGHGCEQRNGRTS